jgi:Flavodoxin-like fold
MMPTLLKGFLEQALRPGFAFKTGNQGWGSLLKGRSARIVVTMGMPAFIYRWYFGAHGLKRLERSICVCRDQAHTGDRDRHDRQPERSKTPGVARQASRARTRRRLSAAISG